MNADVAATTLTSPLKPGDVLWNRLRLDASLEFRPNQKIWRVTDLKTESVHALWFLIPSVSATDRTAKVLSHPILEAVSTVQPALLPFYRMEGNDPPVGAVVALHPLLDSPPWLTAEHLIGLEPVVALEWLNQLGSAVASLHENGLPAHGSITPAQILIDGVQAPVLAGYPHAQFEDPSRDDDFLSPQRRQGNGPQISDDVFGMAALAYFLLSGGAVARPEKSGEVSDLASARARQSLTPLGWKQGWDIAMMRALSPDPSVRPPSVRQLIDSINDGAGHPLLSPLPRELRPPPKARPETLRRIPRWRASLSLNSMTGSVGPAAQREPMRDALRQDSERPAQNATQIAPRATELESLRGEIIREKQLSDALRKRLESERIALAERQAQLDAERVHFNQQQTAFEKEETAFRSRKAAETAAARSLAETNVAKAEAARKELEVRENQLNAILRTFGQVAGGTTLDHLRAFVRELEKRRQELERAGSRLAADRAAFELARSQRVDDGDAQAVPAEPQRVEPVEPIATAPVSDEPVVQVTAPAETATTSEVPIALRATLGWANGRKLHLFTGSILRFGRQADSDVLLFSRLPQLYRELSRKHCEVRIDPGAVQLVDGWSDDGKPSRQGVCIDGRRVATQGELRTGGLVSVTTRAPGPTVPRWRVTVIRREPDPAYAGSGGGAVMPSLFLQRLDEVPDDILVLNDRVLLKELGVSDASAATLAIGHQTDGFVWITGAEISPMREGNTPIAILTVQSLGKLTPTLPPAIGNG